MNIGVITTSYPRWPGDSAGNFVGAHVRALERLGHTVDVIAAAADEPLFYRGGAPDALETGTTWLSAISFTARLVARVIARAHRWDLAIAHWLAPSALAALPTRTPLLAIAHGGDVHTLARMRLLKPTLALLAARGAKLVFVSEQLRALAKVDALVQPMGIDVAHFAALRRAPTNSALVLARLVPLKGVDTAIAATRLTNTPLIIAGDGPERARLQHAARDLPVTFLGAVDTTRRDELLRRAAVVYIPSRILANGRTEGTPLVALEALAAGVPVIASRVGGLADLPIALVPPDDPLALARATPLAPCDVSSYDLAKVTNRLLRYAPTRRSA
jgi:glycosyltransferase involved in cell wall biosynthesis